MKNLFKNLMLVAVAAMAFTACAETNDEVNAVVKKTVVNGMAMIDADDTRSGFVGSETTEDENGKSVTVYKSAWDGDETIKLFAENGLATTATVDAEGKFTAEFEGELPESFFMTVCSPAEAWSDANSFTIPAEQTPRAESVDPAAHIFRAQNVSVTNGTADKIQMGHELAYGKMTVNGVDFEIDHVVIDLVGSFYGYARELSYTLHADNVENNTFWFATEIIDVANFTVTAYDAEGNAVTKSVDVAAAGKTLAFNYGRVSTFSVSGLETPTVPAFTSAVLYHRYDYNDVVVVFSGDGLEDMSVNFYGVAMSEDILQPGEFNIGYGLYNGYCYYGDYNLDTCTASVSFVDGEYNIVFTDLTCGNEILPKRLTYNGLISGMDVLDTREKLATPSATATVEGRTITISWNAVDNVDGYRVKLYSPYDEYFEEVVTGTKYVYEAQLWNTQYSFTIMSYASDDNKTYRSSEDAYVDITTEKDPNGPIADVMATNFAWNSAKDCFDLIVPGFDYFYLQVNSANRPGNNSLLEGDYTYGQNENQFRVRYNNGYVYNYSDTNSNSTMNVSFVDGEYVIIINVNTNYSGFVGSIGYKGMPEGWVAPGTGGSGDDTPEESIVVALTSKGAATYANEYAKSFALSDVSNVNSVRIVFDNGNITGESIAAGSYTWVNSVNNVNNSTYSFINRSLCVNGVSYGNDAVSSAYCVVDDNGVITLEFTVAGRGVVFIYDPASDSGNTGGDSGDSGDSGDNTGGEEWTGREVRLQLLAYMDNALYTNVNNESKYFMTSFRNGIVAGTFVLAGDNKSVEIMTSGHATSQSGLFSGTTPFADGDTVEVINNGGGSYTIIYRVTVNDEKLTATYNGGL